MGLQETFLLQSILKRKASFFGHIARGSTGEELKMIVAEGWRKVGRGRGRRRRRWMDDLELVTGTKDVRKNMEMAEDKERLKMVFTLPESEASIFPSKGLRVVIHEPQTYPWPDFDGINVHPKMTTSIGIQVVMKCANNIQKDSKCDDCRPKCNERIYTPIISSADLDRKYFDFVRKAKSFEDKNGKSTCNSLKNKYQLTALQIYFTNARYKAIDEHPTYSEVAFLSNIGGTFGLFIGLSVITLLEIVELIGTVIMKIVKRFLRRRKYHTVEEMEGPLLFISFEDGCKVNEEAADHLRNIKGNFVVVSIVGKYRSGKSYIMNRFAGTTKSGFQLGHSTQAKTKGLWIWILDHSKDKNKKLVLMDSEGIADAEFNSSENKDVHIFTLCILLSSQLIYNSKSTIDHDAIEKLQFMVEMSRHIKIKSSPTIEGDDNENDDDYKLAFPNFMWIVRDLCLKMAVQNKSITADEYLETRLQPAPTAAAKGTKINNIKRNILKYFKVRKCFVLPIPANNSKYLKKLEDSPDEILSKEFLEGCQDIFEYICTKSPNMTAGFGVFINGNMYVELAKLYTSAINEGVVPCIDNAVDSMAKITNLKALKNSLTHYDEKMAAYLDVPIKNEELTKLHEKFSIEANEILLSQTLFDKITDYQLQFEQSLLEKFGAIIIKNQKKSSEKCQDILRELYEPISQAIKDKAIIKSGGYSEYMKMIQKLKTDYENMTGKGDQDTIALADFILSKNSDFDQILKADQTITEKEQQIEVEKQKALEEKGKVDAAELKNKYIKESHESLMRSIQVILISYIYSQNL
ncbi:Guanylate-binding protein 1 [Nymphon striatum]|nr:Guanylate-binding protein 1 [Nymphon striatum]